MSATPAGDDDGLLARYDLRMRREAAPDEPGARVERAGRVVRQVNGDSGGGVVLWSDLASAADADAAIAEQLAYFGALGRSFEWKLYAHDRPADLGERLTAAGFEAQEPETLMVAEIAALDRRPVWPAGTTVRRVTDADGVRAVIEVHGAVFGGDQEPLRRRLLAQLARDPERVRVLLVLAGERPVCAARLELTPGTGFASLWGGGTLPEWRGKGVYRALVAHRAALAAEAGYHYLQVDASDQSRPVLERLGFTALTATTPYIHTHSAASPA
ncbi:GNAT family N-acetyltransferase [Streptomyces profundus]|uniref:GNAT family N-acetyltransferase n=1 Tax=Streptomyces profundus TaxID=2867410 RepID=UPI001D1684BB|nr:GNAT family N-acetyltransferase [Streptomyces sp. MA3_2.13]UED87296.1 GNAT family N-acetyltransferase [Streptomyces sp. MA3_2.13]